MANAATNAAIEESLRRLEQALIGLPHVVGVGFGLKETRGLITNRPAWRVYVGRKLPRCALRADEVIPARAEGLCTDVVRTSHGLPASGLDSPGAPLAPGAAVSNLRGVLHDTPINRPASGLGTLGFFALVNGGRRRDVVLVSNRHVLLAHGAGCGNPIYRPLFSRRGETSVIRADALDPVAEILDEGAEGNHRFQYAGEPVSDYFVDCATARVLVERGVRTHARVPTGDAGGDALVRGIARIHPLDVVGGRAPRVRKIGGATGITVGRVVDVAAPVKGDAVPLRRHNLVIRGGGGVFVGPGDSGALLLNERDEAVGLLWGRSDLDPQIAYASHIHPVLDRLAITMLSGGQS